MHLLDLPHELLIAIASFLDYKSVCRLGSTCSQLRKVVKDDFLWKQVTGKSAHDLLQKRLFTQFFNSHSWKSYNIWKHEKTQRWKRGICDGYHLLGHTGRVFGVRFWGDHYLLSAADDSLIKIWDLKTRECLHSFSPHPQDGGEREVGALFDVVVDSQRQEQLYACTFGGAIVALRLNLEKKVRLGELRVSELKAMLREFDVPFEDCLFKSDLVNRITSSNILPVVDRMSVIQGHQGPTVTMKTHQGIGVSCSFDGSIQVWDLPQIFSKHGNNSPLCIGTVYGHMSAVNAITWDGTRIASAGNDTLIMLWNMDQEGRHEMTLGGHAGWVWGLEQPFPQSPIYFSASVDETIKIWDIRAQSPCVQTLSDFQGAVSGINLNWDQNRMVSASFDNFVRVFDLRNLAHYYKIEPSLDKITRVVSDDNRIACGGYCGKVAVMEFGFGQF